VAFSPVGDVPADIILFQVIDAAGSKGCPAEGVPWLFHRRKPFAIDTLRRLGAANGAIFQENA
jgi:hypothetical protein